MIRSCDPVRPTSTTTMLNEITKNAARIMRYLENNLRVLKPISSHQSCDSPVHIAHIWLRDFCLALNEHLLLTVRELAFFNSSTNTFHQHYVATVTHTLKASDSLQQTSLNFPIPPLRATIHLSTDTYFLTQSEKLSTSTILPDHLCCHINCLPNNVHMRNDAADQLP